MRSWFPATVFALIFAAWLASFGTMPAATAEEAAALAHAVGCDAEQVAVGSTFLCSFSLENTGEVPLTGVRAAVSLGECAEPDPCIIGVIGSTRSLQLVSAQPPWTGQDVQYGHPFWDPLGSGTLRPGENANIVVTLEAARLDDQERQLVCFGGSGFPTIDDVVSKKPIYSEPRADRCLEIRVVESLPEMGPTATVPATDGPTDAAEDDTEGVTLPATGGGPPQSQTWPVLPTLALAGGALAASIGLAIRGSKPDSPSRLP